MMKAYELLLIFFSSFCGITGVQVAFFKATSPQPGQCQQMLSYVQCPNNACCKVGNRVAVQDQSETKTWTNVINSVFVSCNTLDTQSLYTYSLFQNDICSNPYQVNTSIGTQCLSFRNKKNHKFL